MLMITLIVCVIAISSCDMQDLATATPPPETTADQLWIEHDANIARYDLERVGSWVRVHGIVKDIDSGRVELFGEPDGLRPKVVILHDLSREEQAEAVRGRQFTATCEISKRRWHELDLSASAIHLRGCTR